MSDNTEDPDIGDVQADLGIPTAKAKDMLGLTGHIIRSLLNNDCIDELRESYGLSRAGAAQSLHYVELAELRAWGIDEMIEASLAGQSSTIETLRRRILMAVKAEAVPEYINPADAVLLLERSGLMLVHELREAVAANVWHADFVDGKEDSLENWNRMLRLAGKPALTGELAQAWLADDLAPTEAPTGELTPKHQSKASLQDGVILRWLNENNFDPKNLPPLIRGKTSPKAECRADVTKIAALFSSKSFEIAWERLRRSGEIAGGK